MRKDVRTKTVGDAIRTGMAFVTFLSKETTHDNSSFYDLYFSLDNPMKKNPIETAVLTGIYKLRESDRLFGFFSPSKTAVFSRRGNCPRPTSCKQDLEILGLISKILLRSFKDKLHS